jgi:hypothetical protein
LTETTDTKTCKNNVLLSFNDYYNAGYNQGVADADGRENTSSTSYQSGYDQGHDDGYNEGLADANSVENTSSISYQSGYNQGVDDTKQGTAIESDVLAGVTFTSENGVNLTGTMANNGELNWKPTTSTTYTLTPGYYSGGTLDSSSVYTTGYNDGIKVAKQGTATASQVLTGYTFTNSSNVNISGTMANRGTLNWSPTTSTTYTVQAGYYSGGTLNSSGAYTTGYNQAISDVQKIFIAGGMGVSENFSTFTTINVGNYNSNYASVSGGVITFKKACKVSVCYLSAAYVGAYSEARLYYNGTLVANYDGSNYGEVRACSNVDAAQNSTLYYQVASTDAHYIRGSFYIFTR